MPKTEKPSAPGRLVWSRKETAAAIGCHPVTLRRWEAEGGFPKAVKLGPGSTGYWAADVLAWLDERRQESQPAAS